MPDPTFARQFAMATQEDILRRAREGSRQQQGRPEHAFRGFVWLVALTHRLAVTVHHIAARATL
ncbi:MAG TPA: hypothetical protein VNL71_08955 [Chloroflexota bacterium]|nr:hypothetical protein [Chloroflexota bacterium]